MRGRRKKLEVSTFPFLAVLLCTMGALILVLLAMDRKAKLAAVARAQREAAGIAEKAAVEAAAQRAEWEAKHQQAKADWEKKRDELHRRLLTEEEILRARQRQVAEQLATAAARLRAEQAELEGARRKAKTVRGQLEGEEKTLSAQRVAAAGMAAQSDAAAKGLAKMTEELALLEQALRDLKAAREHARQTYSVVPYLGKRGESRRPLYVECIAAGLVFHPDRKTLLGPTAGEVRVEVDRRVALQRQGLKDRNQPADGSPYLLMLVRPDGISSYYELQNALKDRAVEFGYEFVDGDWVFDFPADDDTPPSKPWTTLGQPVPVPPAEGTISGPPPGKPLASPTARGNGMGGPGIGSGAGMGGGRTGVGTLGGTAGSSGPLPLPASSGVGLGFGGGMGSGLPGMGTGSGAGPYRGGAGGTGDGVAISGGGAGGVIGGTAGSTGPLPLPASGGTGLGFGGGTGSGLPGRGVGSGAGPYRAGTGGTGDGVALGNSGGGVPGQGPAGVGSDSSGGAGVGGGPAGGSLPSARGASEGTTTHLGGGAAGGGGAGGSPSSGQPEDVSPGSFLAGLGKPEARSVPGGPGAGTSGSASGGPAGSASGGSPGQASGGRQPSEGATAPGPEGTHSPQQVPEETRPPGMPRPRPLPFSGGQGDGTPARAEDAALARFAPPSAPATEKPKPRPATMRPASLHGNRDWHLFIECRADSVVLYPSQKAFPLDSLSGAGNALEQAVRQMIERRQGLLKPGEPPFRPQVHFLVRPEHLRAYHLAFPALDGLGVPKAGHKLQPEDDVAAIVAGF